MEGVTIPFSIRLFGGFEVEIRGAPLPRLRSRKEQWLLALLVLERGRAVARPQLAQTLWPFPDHSADLAAYNLRRSLSELRRALGGEAARLLSPTPRSVRLDLEGAAVDLVAFDAAIAQGDPEQLERAVTLYRGPFLPECTEVWALEERARREQDYLQALEILGEQAMARGDLPGAIRGLRLCLAVDPLRERASRALMTALMQAGEANAAIQIYQQLSRLLHHRLNAVPSPETTALFQQLRTDLRQRTSLPASRTAASTAPVVPPPRPLPAPLTSLIGREEQTRGIAAQLSAVRLLTLTGSGGVGKSRLALRVAEELRDDFRDGVCYVDLSALADPLRVPQTVTAALEVREEPGHPLTETLADTLRPRQTLLVLDGCEHLILPCCELVELLLQRCPGLRILTTSRQPLGVPGESLWRVPSLSLPDPRRLPQDERHLVTLLRDYAAIRLFVDRAQLVQPDFELTPDNARAIAQVCLRLDGIPLAIELAAARIRAFPVEQIARRFNQLFRLSTGGPRSALSRQQTMEATIQWSYDLLTPDERLLLARLAVFAGGWTLEAAEEITGTAAPSSVASAVAAADSPRECRAEEVPDLLARLIDRSLVLYEPYQGQGRYRMLETVRQYANERRQELDEVDHIGRRHLEYYLRLAESAAPTLFGSGAESRLAQLEADHDNLHAALEWALAGDRSSSLTGASLTGALLTEVGCDLQQRSGAYLPEALRLATALWRFWYRRAYLTEGRTWLAAVLARTKGAQTDRACDPMLRAGACHGAGFLAFHQGDLLAARAYYAEALDLAEETGDDRLIATTLHYQGYMAWYLNDCVSARERYERELEIRRRMGDLAELAATLSHLGIIAGDMGDIETAHAHFAESLEIANRLGDRALVAGTLHSQAHLALYQHDYPLAQRLYEQVLALGRELNDTTRIVTALHRLGTVAEAARDLPLARHYFAESLELARKMEEKNFIAAALLGLGNALRALGEHPQAHETLRESLEIYHELQDKRALTKTLDAFVWLALAEEAPQRAATLLGTINAIRNHLGSTPLPPTDEAVIATRAALSEADFDTSMRRGSHLTPDAIVHYVLTPKGKP